MARPLVVILDDWQDAFAHQPSLERLAERAEIRRYTDPAPTFEGRARRLAGAVAVVAMRERTPFDAALFAAASDLRLLVQTGSGLHTSIRPRRRPTACASSPPADRITRSPS